VSIYMPLVAGGAQAQQNPLRLRNLLDSAQRELETQGHKHDSVAAILAPLRSMQASDDFWRKPAPGLALFATHNENFSYKLPCNVSEQVCVEPRFEIRQLLPLAFDGGYFFMLCANLGGSQLFSGTRHHCTEIEIPNAPPGVEEFRIEDEPLGVKFHGGTGRGPRTGMFYGHNEQEENRDYAVTHYIEQLANAVDNKLDRSTYPLIIAAEAQLIGELRPRLKYPHLVDAVLSGNPRMQQPRELWDKAVPLVEGKLEAGRSALLEQIQERQGRDGHAVADNVGEVLFSAYSGAVDALFIASDFDKRGYFESSTGNIAELPPQEAGANGSPDAGTASTLESLVNLAAVYTVRNGGKCFISSREEMPGGQDIVALLRFQV
jgi:hypothetical protein